MRVCLTRNLSPGPASRRKAALRVGVAVTVSETRTPSRWPGLVPLARTSLSDDRDQPDSGRLSLYLLRLPSR
jgi:hypothetical protein